MFRSLFRKSRKLSRINSFFSTRTSSHRRLLCEQLEDRRMLSWTVMAYLNGDNNLESNEIAKFLAMANVGSNQDLNIIVQLDRSTKSNNAQGYTAAYDDWTDARRGIVNSGNTPSSSWGTSIGEVDMGDASTLANFVNWATTNYKADNYALFISDHGGGVNTGVSIDNSSGDDWLTVSELSTACSSISHLNLIGFDACLMGMVEVAYQLKNYADVMVASENISYRLDYSTVLKPIKDNPVMNAQTYGSEIVKAYKTTYASNNYITLSEINLSQISNLATNLNNLADYMLLSATGDDWSAVYKAHNDSQILPVDLVSGKISNNYQYYDLGDWMTRITSSSASADVIAKAQNVIDALSSAVIANHAGSGITAKGLSIYAPFSELDSYYKDPANVAFVNDTDWDPFVGPHGIDVIEIIDHSGSMADDGKLTAAQAAADAFIELLSTDATNGDKIGIVGYSTTASTVFPLTRITNDSVKDNAIAAVDSLYPTDMTSIGAGIYVADNQLDTDSSARVRAMLLLSDGLENTAPYALDAINSAVASNIVIYTIGLGSNVDGNLLSEIARSRGGKYYFAASSADIRSIYLALSAKLAGKQTASHSSGTIIQGQQITQSVLVDSLSSQATFALDWEGSDMDLSLIAPDGTTIDYSNVSSHPNVSYVDGGTYKVFTVDLPKTGEWQLVVTGVNVPAGGETYHLLITVASPIQLNITTDKTSYSTGDVIHIQSSLTDFSAIIGATVTATIEAPNGSEKQIQLYDDGLHNDGEAGDGAYANNSSILALAGSYTISVDAQGDSNYGMPFVRTDFLSISATGSTILPFTATVNKSSSQPDPANSWPIHFNVVFSEAVTDFATGDVNLTGTAGASIAIVTPLGADGTTYDVAVSGMIGSGTVIAGIAEGVAHDAAGNPNAASTNDESINFIVSGTPTFQLTGPTSGTYAPVQSITITWTAGNIPANCSISLCLDRDTKWWNGNEKWIEIGQVVASNSAGSYSIDPARYPPGAYYVGGYLYNHTTNTPVFSHLNTPIVILATTFTLAGPISGTYAPGQSVEITWTANNVPANCSVSLCLDPDTKWWNGNEQWIEIGKKAAANGSDSYVFDTSGITPGSYYVGGYLFNHTTNTPTFSRLNTPIQFPAPTFTLTGPISGTYVPGQSVTITWTANYVPANCSVSICLDKDTKWGNSNEQWIEIGKKTAANGSDSYVFDLSGVVPGAYYVGGYLYNHTTHIPAYSHLSTPITIPSPTFAFTAPTSGTFTAGQQPVTIQWTAGNVGANSSISLCYDPDAKWNGNEKWIEIGQKAAVNGSDSYTWNTSGVAPGTYYVGGYLYNNTTHTPTYSHLSTPIILSSNSFQTPAAMLLTVDNLFTAYTPKQYANEIKVNSPDEEFYTQNGGQEDEKAIDLVLQGPDTWLEGKNGYLMENV
jgi:Mg-chelatase subunit ChlD